MGLYTAGILTGLLMSLMIQLIRCAVWFERMHPEDDYWHRGNRTYSETPKEEKDGCCSLQGRCADEE